MASTDALRDAVQEGLEDLPEERVREVADFVAFLRQRELEGEDPMLRASGLLEGSAPTSEEIDETLYGEDPA